MMIATLRDACADGGLLQTGPFGSQLHATDYVDDGVPVIMPTNIGENRVVQEGIARVTEEMAVSLKRHRLRAGDIVYSRRGDITRRALIRDEVGWLCGTGCLLVRPGAMVDPVWLSYWLGTPETQNWLMQHAVGATMPNLNTEILGSVPVAAPPLDEQRRIAEVLGALDDLIDTNTRSIGAIEGLLQSQFEAFSFDSAGGTKLIDRVELNPNYIKPKGVAPYVDMAALPTNSFFIEDVSSRLAAGGARFKRNDVLLARITPCLENGKAAFAGNLLEDEVYVGSTEFIVMRSRAGVPAAWPFFLARSERFREFAIRHMTGSSGRQRLAAAALENYEVGGDSAALLKFGRLAAKLLEAAIELSEESKTLRRTRDELLPLLMSGTVRVKPEEVAA
jgi:type I restriction enzyme, S subunit